MDLQHALEQVSEIRAHLARTEVFRGYRSLTVAITGLLGWTGAAVQSRWLPEPVNRLQAYLALWIGVAAASVIVVGAELAWRAWSTESPLARRSTRFAVGQLVPALAAGALLTLVIVRQVQEAAWMLPGLWALLFSLGIFASCRLLPRAIVGAGMWYMAAGLLALAWGQGEAALSPWLMGVAFGGGQFLTAVILHVTLERPDLPAD
jgi:hypothetical protein